MALPAVEAAVEDLTRSHRELLRLVDSLSEGDWERAVPYGEWTVKDLIAHVIGDMSPGWPGLILAGVLTPRVHRRHGARVRRADGERGERRGATAVDARGPAADAVRGARRDDRRALCVSTSRIYRCWIMSCRWGRSTSCGCWTSSGAGRTTGSTRTTSGGRWRCDYEPAGADVRAGDSSGRCAGWCCRGIRSCGRCTRSPTTRGRSQALE